jgi:hypothetical protein
MATKKPLSAKEGVQLEEKASAVTYNEQNEGLIYNNNDTELRVQIEGADREILTADQTSTVTNKSIDADNNTITNLEVDNLKAGVLDTDLTSVSASDDTIPSAKATKAYVDAQVAEKDQASEISYDNSTSGLSATNVQTAIDEVEGRVDTAETDITNIEAKTDFITVTQAVNLDTMESDIATNASGLSDHLADTTDAHDASAISYVNTTSGLTATEVQSAIDEVEGRVDTAETDISNIETKTDFITVTQAVDLDTMESDIATNASDISTNAGAIADHIADTTDAHAGSAITNTPAGNLAATDVQGALNELQGDIDTLDASSHTQNTDTGTTANTFSIGDNLDTDKTIEFDNGDANNPSIRFNATSNALEFANDGVTFQEFGSGGGGGLDTFYTEDFETTLLASIDDGNNATFLGGGTLAGTKAYETSSPISGTQSLKYTQASGSLNDYIALPAITLEDKQKGNDLGFVQYFTYDGDAGDIEVIVWDVTNSKQLVLNVSSEQTKYYTNKGNPTRFTVQVYPPTTATTLRVGFQVKVENIGAVLVVDDIEGSSNPFVQMNLYSENVFSARIANNGTASITSQSSPDNPAIASVNRTGIGVVVVTFTSGFFNVIPSVSGVSDGGGNFIAATALTTNSVTLTNYSHTGGVLDANFEVTFTRQGSDYRFETPAVVHSSTGTENDFSAVIPSSGTAVTSEGASAISSLSWGGNTATLTLNSGQFTVAPAVDIFPEPTSYTVSNTTITATYGSPTAFNIKISSQGADYKNPNAYAVTTITNQVVQIVDGVTAPDTESFAQLYIDSADGDLKIKFSDGTVKTIATDT